MKFSVIALSGIVLAFPGMVEGQTCVDKIDKAQECVSECLDIPNGGNNTLNTWYGNQLTYCLDPTIEQTESLESCCDMDSSKGIWTYTATSCNGSLGAANDCLTTELADVKAAGVEYLECIADMYTIGFCSFANFCLALLAGGYGTGVAEVDFAVGSASILADDFRNAATCEDPLVTSFGKNVCEAGNGCCSWCNEELEKVVNTVMDDILLPTYSSLSDCGGDTTCQAYMDTTSQRDLEMVRPETTTSPENAELALELGSECTSTLSQEIVVYNETYAISNYFGCLGNKMAKIAAETDEAKQESSGISLSLGPVTTLSMIASAVYFVIA